MEESAPTIAQGTLRSVLRNRNLRLLWIGETLSQLCDQFYLIGLPLLVLSITKSSEQFGLLLFVEGVPRAALMLLGGVITDRVSPRRVMIFSNAARLLLTLFLGALIINQHLEIWMLYIAAFLFGTVDAFFQPAFLAIVPALVDQDELQASNSLMQSSTQAVQGVGPGLAGLVIGFLGVGLAVILDAFSFLFTTLLLFAMRNAEPLPLKDPSERQTISAIFRDLGSIIGYVSKDRLLRPYMLLILLLNLTLAGPSTVGVAVLAENLFKGSPVAFGWMLSAMGIGAVLGSLMTGFVKVKRFGVLFLTASGLGGVLLMLIGLTESLELIALLFGSIAFIIGFTNVLLLTWFGKQIPPGMMGRFMGLYVLLGVGIAPLSNAIAGVLFSVSIMGTFLLAGALQLGGCVFAGFSPSLRQLEI